MYSDDGINDCNDRYTLWVHYMRFYLFFLRSLDLFQECASNINLLLDKIYISFSELSI